MRERGTQGDREIAREIERARERARERGRQKDGWPLCSLSCNIPPEVRGQLDDYQTTAVREEE